MPPVATSSNTEQQSGVKEGAGLPATEESEEDDLVQVRQGRSSVGLPIEGAPNPQAAELEREEGGRLQMKVVDSITLETLAQYELNLSLASAPTQRLFTVASENLQQMRIPSEVYVGVLFHPGYDLQQVNPFTVRDGETTDLGLMHVERGSATVSGQVLASPALLASVQNIDLHSAGRWPGLCCETEGEAKELTSSESKHCLMCGYGETFSRRPYKVGSRFNFEDLSSGPLRLVVRGESDSILAIKHVELEPHEMHFVEIEISLKDIEIRLVDGSGAPFDGVWAEDADLFSAPIQFNIYADGVIVAIAELPAAMKLGEELSVGTFPASTDTDLRSNDEDPDASRALLKALWPKALISPTDMKLS